MPRLTLHFLGVFQVILDGKPVTTFRSDKERALLAYLAVESDRPHRRDSLAALLWPDLPDRQARNNLRQSLFRLRRAIQDTGDQPLHLHVSQESLQFNAQSAWLDSADFSAIIHQAEQHAHQNLGACQDCMPGLQDAANLYQGEFLSGLYLDDSPAFSEWAMLKREWLHIKALQTLDALAAFFQRRGEPQLAINYAHRQLELEPWREESHRQLMGLLARSGQFSAALKQYETGRHIIRQEFNLEPSHETTELYERILLARDKPRHNLPAQATSFVGRRAELARIRERLADPNCRLLTVLGPGGTGKSRLALRAAEAQLNTYLNGVFVAALAEVRSAEQLPAAIAAAIGFEFHEGESPEEQLSNYLRNKEMLLILDNFEYLSASAAHLSKMLAGAPHLKLLVTSVQRLELPEEWVLPIEGLECPPPGQEEALASYSAAHLFIQRARRAYPGFDLEVENPAAIVRICHLVEGMPLALELAAAWARSLPLEQIIAEIEANLDFLSSPHAGITARHRSVVAAFEHSWSLLVEGEKSAFMKTAVFRGGFDRPAAEAIAGAALSVLTALVDKSLLRRKPMEAAHTAMRYDVHELLGQFAAHKLADTAAEGENTRERHARYYLDWLHERAGSLQGEDQLQSVQAISLELENLRTALDWAVERWDLDGIARAMDLFDFYDLTGRFLEAIEVFEVITRALGGSMDTPGEAGWQKAGLYARSLGCLAWNKLYASDFEAAWSLCQRGLEVARAVNDEGALIWNRYVEGLACLRTGKYDQAADCFDACLAYWGQNGAKFWQAKCLSNLGRTFYLWGKPEGAQHFLNRSLLLHTEVGDKLGMSISHSRLADVAAALDDYVQAERHLEHCLMLLGEFQPYWKATTLKKLGDVAGQSGQYHRAVQYFRDSLLIFKDTGVEFQATETLISFSRVNLALGQSHQAWEQIREALRLALGRHPVLMALKALLVVAALLHAEERYAGALEVLAFVVAHPGADHHTRQEAERLLDALQPEVPARAFTRAQERATLLDLHNIASQYL